MTQYNYQKLLGRMREKNFTQADLAGAIHKNIATINLKLQNKGFFSQIEITEICMALCIPISEIGEYFFCIVT